MKLRIHWGIIKSQHKNHYFQALFLLFRGTNYSTNILLPHATSSHNEMYMISQVVTHILYSPSPIHFSSTTARWLAKKCHSVVGFLFGLGTNYSTNISRHLIQILCTVHYHYLVLRTNWIIHLLQLWDSDQGRRRSMHCRVDASLLLTMSITEWFTAPQYNDVRCVVPFDREFQVVYNPMLSRFETERLASSSSYSYSISPCRFQRYQLHHERFMLRS